MAIYCDASYNSNGATIGVYIQNVCSKFKRIKAKDSGHAERMAIKYAMEIAYQNGIIDTVYSDSKMTVDKVSREGNGGSKTIKQIKHMMRRHGFKLRWKRRTNYKIKIADKISRRYSEPTI